VTRAADLYALEGEPPRADAPVLLHALTGFLDAGSGGSLAVRHLLETLEHRVVARFDVDALYDYRARRPRMVFDTDHYGDLEWPEIVVRELVDAGGVPFLLLDGPEPDLGWRAFTAAIVDLVERLGVRLTVGMHAVPWPAPHTRPVGISAHANDIALIPGRTPWVGEIQIPGHLGGVLELTLGEAGQPALGFAAHVPHYLAAGEHPRAALALLEEVARATGLRIPLDALRTASDIADADLNAQVASSEENTVAVRALEAQHDAFVERRAAEAGAPAAGPEVPTGDEIAAQVEQFLAEMDARGRDD
jgi:predicted ATP-grasp superfamily ATP-dependent carboligase